MISTIDGVRIVFNTRLRELKEELNTMDKWGYKIDYLRGQVDALKMVIGLLEEKKVDYIKENHETQHLF